MNVKEKRDLLVNLMIANEEKDAYIMNVQKSLMQTQNAHADLCSDNVVSKRRSLMQTQSAYADICSDNVVSKRRSLMQTQSAYADICSDNVVPKTSSILTFYEQTPFAMQR